MVPVYLYTWRGIALSQGFPSLVVIRITWWGALCWFPVAAIRKDHKLGGLKQKLICSQFWRPEVQNQGVCRLGSFWKLSGTVCSVLLS